MNSEVHAFSTYQKSIPQPCNSTYPSNFIFDHQIYKLKSLLDFPVSSFSIAPPIIAFYPEKNLAQGFDNIYFFNAYLKTDKNKIEIKDLSLIKKTEDQNHDYHFSALFQENLLKAHSFLLKEKKINNNSSLLLLDESEHTLMIFEPDTFNYNIQDNF